MTNSFHEIWMENSARVKKVVFGLVSSNEAWITQQNSVRKTRLVEKKGWSSICKNRKRNLLSKSRKKEEVRENKWRQQLERYSHQAWERNHKSKIYHVLANYSKESSKFYPAWCYCHHRLPRCDWEKQPWCSWEKQRRNIWVDWLGATRW